MYFDGPFIQSHVCDDLAQMIQGKKLAKINFMNPPMVALNLENGNVFHAEDQHYLKPLHRAVSLPHAFVFRLGAVRRYLSTDYFGT